MKTVNYLTQEGQAWPNFKIFRSVGRTVEMQHINNKSIIFTIDRADIGQQLKQWALRKRIKHFHDHGTMEGY